MNNFNHLFNNLKNIKFNKVWQTAKGLPMYKKIIVANASIFLLWRLRIVSQSFMVKHFTLSRHNIRSGRIHTLVTYSFSHLFMPTFLLNTFVFSWLGKYLEAAVGGRMLLGLYLAGSVAGGSMIAMFMPQNPDMIQPRFSMSNSLNAMLAFMCLRNPGALLNVFGFTMKTSTFLIFMGLQSLLFDPAFSGVASMGAGAALSYVG